MKMSEKTDKLFPALFKVKQKVGSVEKNAKNPHFKNNYADLNTHIETLEPVLQENGLMLLQPPVVNSSGLNSLVTMIVHVESGQWIQSEISLVNTPDMQKTLGAITYARRGSLNALFGLASEDDDGETAVGRGPQQRGAQNSPKPAAKPEQQASKEDPKPFNRSMAKKEQPTAQPAQQSNGSAKKDVVW